MSYRLCVFDFDGTIADTLEQARLILNDLALDYGFKQVSAEDLPSMRQLSSKQLLKKLGVKKRWVPRLLARGTRQLKSRLEQIALIEGVKELIEQLSGQSQRMGILTSNSVENVELFLAAHGLQGRFEFISSVSKLSGKHKHLRSILRTFSLEPEELLYIGDEVRDVKASHRARVDVAAVSWGFNSREALETLQPTFLIDQPDELLKLLSSE